MTGEVVPIRPAKAVAVSHNLNGQRLGRKGRDTRDRIIAVANDLLSDPTDESPLTLSEVARRAELRLGTLYLYFADLGELMLALLEPVMATAEAEYVVLLRDHWDDSALGERTRDFVGAYYGFWRKNTRMLHLRNSMADRGDDRMMLHRVRSAQPVMRLIASQMGSQPTVHGNPNSAMATVLMTGLERVATVMTDPKVPYLLNEPGNPIDLIIAGQSRLFELAIRDRRAQVNEG